MLDDKHSKIQRSTMWPQLIYHPFRRIHQFEVFFFPPAQTPTTRCQLFSHVQPIEDPNVVRHLCISASDTSEIGFDLHSRLHSFFLSVTIPISACSNLHCLGSIQPIMRTPKGVRAPLFRPVEARPFLPVTRPTLSGQGAGFSFLLPDRHLDPQRAAHCSDPSAKKDGAQFGRSVRASAKFANFVSGHHRTVVHYFLGGGFTNVPQSDVLAKPIL